MGDGVLYIHNSFTGWSAEPLPAGQGTTGTGVCPATNTTSPIPTDPTTYPPNTTANPNNTYNMFCSPDLAVTIPAAAVFLSGSPTSAYGQCPETTVKPVVNYPEATTVAVASDHVASTTDGKHIIGATANPPTLTDLSITVPIDACPSDANSQTTGIVFNPPPVANQASLAAYGITNINQVVAATNSLEAFVTYSSDATAPPAGGALLPVYKPSATAGTLGTLSSVKLTGNALAPVAGIFSPDNTIFFAGTTGDDLLHLIDTTTLLDTQQINPKLTDINGKPLPPVFLAVKPRPDYLAGVLESGTQDGITIHSSEGVKWRASAAPLNQRSPYDAVLDRYRMRLSLTESRMSVLARSPKRMRMWQASCGVAMIRFAAAREWRRVSVLQAPSRSQPRTSEIWSASVKGSKGLERIAAAPSSSSLRRSWPCTFAVSRSTGI